jgi:hypothetical protein
MAHMRVPAARNCGTAAESAKRSTMTRSSRSLPRRAAVQHFGCALLAAALLALPPAGAARAEDESWRFYRNATPRFTVLYPTTLASRRVGKRLSPDSLLAQEWQLPGGAGDIRLVIYDLPAGAGLADWTRTHVGANALPTDVAGLPAASVESLADGAYTTTVFINESKSGKIISFVLAIRNLPPGTTLDAAKTQTRAQVTQFWRMVESLKLDE